MVDKLLKQGADPNKETSTIVFLEKGGTYPIITASRYSSYEIVELLIKYGADVNVDDGSMTPLVACTFRRDNNEIYEIAKLLLDNGADINKESLNDVFLFNVNAVNPSILNDTISYELTKLAIEYGADVNYYNKQIESTSLMYAIRHNRLVNAKLLIENGADFLEFKNKDGKNAYDLAKEIELTEVVDMMELKMDS